MSIVAPLPSLTRLQTARPSALDDLLGLLARPILCTLAGPPELASLAGYALGLRAASEGRRVTLRDLRENPNIGRTLELTESVNFLDPGPRLLVDRDPIALDTYADNGAARRRLIAQLRADRPDLVVIDALQHAMAGPSLLKPGYLAERAVETLRTVIAEVSCSLIVLTGTMPTIVDEAADIRLTVKVAGRIVTLSTTHKAPGREPGPVHFELVRHGDHVALRAIDAPRPPTHQPN